VHWFDAHLDIAYLALAGRNLGTHDPALAGGPHPPAALTIPALQRAGVTRVLATIFTEAIEPGKPCAEPQQYAQGDAASAARCGRAQLDWYARHAPDLGLGLSAQASTPLRADLLVECADPIAGAHELAHWHAAGVRAIGLTWVGQGRYAGGNAVRTGLSGDALPLLLEMARLGIVPDVSHLSDRSFDDLCEATGARIIASHSNARALLGEAAHGVNQRHLRDAQIRAIAQRDGVIGLNLFSAFLDPSCRASGRATVAQAIDHVEHVCMLTGSHAHVGLGSDLDGGFAADRLPAGINSPTDYERLADELRRRGWSDGQIAQFAHANWERVFGA
jgi:membrane dipeptidase